MLKKFLLKFIDLKLELKASYYNKQIVAYQVKTGRFSAVTTPWQACSAPLQHNSLFQNEFHGFF